MSLLTGTPLGVITQQDEIYLDTAPTFFFQNSDSGSGVGSQGYLHNPDAQGFYWSLTGSSTNPVYELGCYDTFVLAGNIEMNNIRCDTVGDKGTIQRLNYLDVTFNLKTMFPLTTVQQILRGGAVTTVAGSMEEMGIGQPNNNIFFRAYFPTVYDPTTGDYLAVTMHRVQFVDSWQIAFNYGQPSILGVTARGFSDATKPSDQLFATIIRADPSAL